VTPHELSTYPLIDQALLEDLGQAGDITTDAIVPSKARAVATFVARGDGRVAGTFVAKRVFETLSEDVSFNTLVEDGADVRAGEPIARVSGKARAILSGERTALNFLGHLSGIATLTRRYKNAIGRTPPEIVATRKTTPGLRALEKYSVRCGGGGTHRYGLYDAVLIKDNHIAIAGGLREAVERARVNTGHLVKIQVEVDTLAQLEELLAVGADAVLLDNMSPDTLLQAVGLCEGKMLTEASGGITLDTIRDVADSGVDQISAGALTHSAASLDIGLDLTS
jgi:nicotinate-nucleotide pyrophosphorylase (carboxylating)